MSAKIIKQKITKLWNEKIRKTELDTTCRNTLAAMLAESEIVGIATGIQKERLTKPHGKGAKHHDLYVCIEAIGVILFCKEIGVPFQYMPSRGYIVMQAHLAPVMKSKSLETTGVAA